MMSLFDPQDREAILQRVAALKADSPRQWGKMDPAQALAHCARVMELATGERPMKQMFIGRLLTPLIRKSILGEKPFGRNAPTGPDFVVADPRELDAERARYRSTLDRFVAQGPGSAAQYTHAFFGRLSGEEWGRLMYKHLDHHLRQFGV